MSYVLKKKLIFSFFLSIVTYDVASIRPSSGRCAYTKPLLVFMISPVSTSRLSLGVKLKKEERTYAREKYTTSGEPAADLASKCRLFTSSSFKNFWQCLHQNLASGSRGRLIYRHCHGLKRWYYSTYVRNTELCIDMKHPNYFSCLHELRR